MHFKTKDLTGKKFQHITVLSYSKKQLSKGHSYWNCICDCGYKYLVRGSHLIDGRKSCGRTNKCKFAYNIAETDFKRKKARENHIGSKNHMWKGENASIGSKHNWLHNNYKKGNMCEHCKSTGKKLDWALIHGKKYNHNRKNFIELCRSCHLKYDYTEERKRKIGIATKKRHERK